MSSATQCGITLLIFTFSIIFIAYCDLPEKSETADTVPFPKEKCEALLTNCSCLDYIEVYGIICNGKNDFENFSHILNSGEVFEKGSTYEIVLSGIQYVPARILEGLIVFRLYLDDPGITKIDKDAFEGVKRLRRFHVRQSGIQEIPDMRALDYCLRNFNMDSSKLTALNGTGLQGLYKLNRISFFNNSIRYIDPDVFKDTNDVHIFDISKNLLTYIPPDLLHSWPNLTKLVLSQNQLLHVDQLFAVTHPQFIYLDSNNITDVDSVLHFNMTKVETVALANNPLRKVTEQSFIDKIPNVRFLYLDHCQLQEFDVRPFRQLPILATLDLSYNLFEEIPEQKIDIGYEMELDLFGNQIRKFDAEVQYTVKRLYLYDNKLQSLGRTLQYSQIVEVSVASNLLQYLSTDDFRGVHNTANLELQSNRIQWIDRFAFLNIRNDLHYLDLSDNLISSLNGSIRYLSQLKSLNMSDNRIEAFEIGEFTGLNELSELYLPRNRIKDLSGRLQLLPQLQYLVITHNRVETLSPSNIPKMLKYIYLAENPIKCDCRLYPFLLQLKTSNSPGTDIPLCPTVSKNQDLQQPNTTCPEMCSCACAEDGDDSFINVDCSSKNLTEVPSFLTSDFFEIQDTSRITFEFRRSLTFDQNDEPLFHIHDRVMGLDLENNSLKSMDSAQLPPDLIHLYLSNNHLRSLPESMLYTLAKLRRVSLSENPWDCDCNAVGFKQWLVSKMEYVQDVNVTRCGPGDNNESKLSGKVIWRLTDLDLCPADIGLYVSVAFGILIFLLLCLAIKILYTRYKMHIKVYLYSHGITWVKAEDLDYDKTFDAFISFSHKDEAFVANEMISVIEKRNPNIRMCIHYKHFRPGEYITDNIIYAVQNSKKTVLVLSRNFLESDWCLWEFRAAHLQALEDKVHRIIVIKVGDLPDDIDPSIKVYLESTTYLTWGEKNFWNNLLYILPTSSNVRNVETQNNCIKLQQITDGLNVKA